MKIPFRVRSGETIINNDLPETAIEMEAKDVFTIL
jgi:hypothetical protein